MNEASGLPARPTWYVGRAGISASLDRANWLTTVIAGAGAGKTAATGGWASARHAAWLALRPEDAGLTTFLPRLLGATHAAGMGDLLASAVRGALGGGATDDDTARADALASLVAGVVDQVPVGGLTGGHAIVLDGFDRLPADCGAVRFVEALSRQAPAGLRVVVTSRTPMPFAVQRLRETGRLTELGGSELAFGVDETYQLLTIALGDAAGADELAGEMHTLTAGWPAQVSLGAAWLAQQPANMRRSRLATFGAFDRELADSVLANASADSRGLVRAAAYLPRVNEPLLRAIGLVGPDVDAIGLLARAAPLVLPEPTRPGWFRVGNANRVAVHQTQPLAPEERRTLLRAAIDWYATHGEVDASVATAKALRDAGVLNALLDRHGAELIAAGHASDVISAIETIPYEERSPFALLVESEVRHSGGDVAGALRCLEAVDMGGGELTPAMARRIGKIRQLAGDIAGARDVYARTRFDGTQPIDEAIVVSQLATVHWLRGDIDEARLVVAEAIKMAEACADQAALAGAYATASMIADRDGDQTAADDYVTRATVAAQAGGDLVQLIRIRINRSQRHVQAGRNADALVEIEEAIRLTEVTGTVGWFGSVARTNRGWAYRGLGRYDEALAEFTSAREFWRSAGSDLIAYSQIGLGATYLDRGDVAAADAELSAAVEIGERSGDHQAMTGLATLGRARYATDPAEAWRLVQRAMETAPGHWKAWAILTLGWCALCEGDEETARAQAAAAHEFSLRFPDPFAIAEADELYALSLRDHAEGARLLVDVSRQYARLGNPVFVHRVGVAQAYRAGRGIAAAEARLRATGVRPAAGLAAGPLRAVGAFRNAPTGLDAARFTSAASQAVTRFERDGDSRGVRQALADALALLPAPPAGPGQVRDHYVAVLETLAAAFADAGDVDASLAWQLRILEDDPGDEATHLAVVSTLSRAGRATDARRRYRLYTEQMRIVGREPAPYPSEVSA